ncbi:ExbD/TolR family protein [Marilutibacter maris]|uniref:Biopolymer transporter ExbD n=1 Tax=Marilutibacter maris TaxID=1605891 RepID=A0A2U9T5H6_9GAMM|nr:biopolymer transporter ExbD [Lysobacter maris]AWV05738.1 biopolymer transporter ExbD [Lysobacter maris]KAB8166929.1 biopolymer transporter ExbD [Lysobacter maris]
MAVSVQSRSPFDNARGSAALAEINITPLIDVMLVLLIIFMVIAPVATRSLDARLPQPSKLEPNPQKIEKIELLARGNDRFSLDGVVMDSAMLAQSLAARAASGEPQVLMVGASDDADYQAFADALKLARASGIGEIAHAQ